MSILLDERLSLAASLYEPSDLAADIGTDHGLLPCYLLEQNLCRRMLLCDVSPKAICHAEETVARCRLQDRAQIICVEGLRAVTEPCGCISIMGMGGDTMAAILREGADRLHGAVLVLSAHTHQDKVRQAVVELGYHFTREVLCRAAGRFYIIWRAEPGAECMTEDELRYGKLMYTSPTPLLKEYLQHRISVWDVKHSRLQATGDTTNPEYQDAVDALRCYRKHLEELP